MYRSCVLGSANYLLGLIEPSSEIVRHLDKHSKSIICTALQLPDRACDDLRWSEGRLPAALGLLLRERSRLYLKALHTPFTDSILHQVTAVLRQRNTHAPDRYATAHFSTSWLLRTERIWAQHGSGAGRETVPPPVPRDYWDIPRTAAVYARAVAFADWQVTACTTAVSKLGLVPQPVDFQAGSENSQREHAAFLNLGYNAPVASLGEWKNSTPLSARGPGCSGALLAAVSKRLPWHLWRMLTGPKRGREGFRNALSWKFDAQSHAASEADPQCRTCGITGQEEGPMHASCTCSCAAVVEAREVAIQSLPAAVERIVRLALHAIRPKDGQDGAAAAHDALTAVIAAQAEVLARAQDWASPEGHFVLYRLLTLTTWPAQVPLSEPGPLTRLLGRVFDTVNAKPHRIRPLANMWAAWASRRMYAIHHAYYAHWQAPTL